MPLGTWLSDANNSDWLRFLLQTGILAAVLGVMVGFANLVLKWKFDQKLESLKITWGRDAYRYQIRFSRLYERQASVIADLYSLFVEASNLAENFVEIGEDKAKTHGDPLPTARYDAARDAIVAVVKYYQRHRLYLEDSTAEKIESAYNALKSLILDFRAKQRREATGYVAEDSDEDSYISAHLRFTNVVTPALDALHEDFQRLLGVLPESAPAGITPAGPSARPLAGG